MYSAAEAFHLQGTCKSKAASSIEAAKLNCNQVQVIIHVVLAKIYQEFVLNNTCLGTLAERKIIQAPH